MVELRKLGTTNWKGPATNSGIIYLEHLLWLIVGEECRLLCGDTLTHCSGGPAFPSNFSNSFNLYWLRRSARAIFRSACPLCRFTYCLWSPD